MKNKGSKISWKNLKTKGSLKDSRISVRTSDLVIAALKYEVTPNKLGQILMELGMNIEGWQLIGICRNTGKGFISK